MDKKRELTRMILATSAYFKERLPDEVISLYADDLIDLPLDAVARVLADIRRDPKQRGFPLPAIVRDRITPYERDGQSDDAEAREAVARILTAISRYGHCNLERARAFIGELGWYVVSRQGGWENVCQATFEQLTTWQAQWRELAIATQRRARAGQLDHAPGLPEAKTTGKMLAALGVSLRALPETTKGGA